MSNFLPWGILFAYLGGGPGKAYYIFEFSYFQGLGGGVGSEPRPPLDPCMYFSSFDSLFVRRCLYQKRFFSVKFVSQYKNVLKYGGNKSQKQVPVFYASHFDFKWFKSLIYSFYLHNIFSLSVGMQIIHYTLNCLCTRTL